MKKTDQNESLKYYKLSADQENPRSQFIYTTKIKGTNPNLSLQYYISFCIFICKSIKSQEFLATKYAKENDPENIYKYITTLIKIKNLINERRLFSKILA